MVGPLPKLISRVSYGVFIPAVPLHSTAKPRATPGHEISTHMCKLLNVARLLTSPLSKSSLTLTRKWAVARTQKRRFPVGFRVHLFFLSSSPSPRLERTPQPTDASAQQPTGPVPSLVPGL